MKTTKKRVLFLCTGNSARSQMAEAVLRHRAGEKFDVYSAGTAPETVDKRTLAALAEFGMSTGQLVAKNVSQFIDQKFDFVITLCDKAHQECQSFPTTGSQMAWDFEDPKCRLGPVPFQKTLEEIDKRISMFLMVQSTVQPQSTIDPIEFYKCFTDEIRLRCLMLIQYEGELCVCELMEALNDIQPKVSRHLALLKKSGLLIDRKQGQWVFYRINPDLPEWAKSVLAQTAESNVGFVHKNIQNLFAMGNRPDRKYSYCK